VSNGSLNSFTSNAGFVGFCNQPFGSNTMVYFEVDDVDRKYEELVELGITFDNSPTDQNWKWREVRFTDPTGNKLCLFHAGLDRRFPPWRIEDQHAGD
jgi:uncharacterized glyoxalase superfamily protein PhnB